MLSEHDSQALSGGSSRTKAEQLIMVNLTGSACDNWLNAMQRAGQPWTDDVLETLSDAKAVLAKAKKQGVHLLVLYRKPADVIAEAIINGARPTQALTIWRGEADELLNIYRHHRRQMTLVERRGAEANSETLSRLLDERTGIKLETLAQSTYQPSFEHQDDKAIFQALALQALQDQKGKHLAQELEASSLPLVDSEAVVTVVDQAFDAIQSQVGEGNKELEAENALLLEQLHHTQEELERYYLSLKKTEVEISKKNDKIKSFSQKNKKLKSEIDRLRNSKSWKITAPLRNGIKVLGSKKKGERANDTAD
ncbi:hypothetical protein [Litchfieldella rifensis]|uniref:Uncharacterized protein n=1 Tax=Litchfieldella rifensis TaxID=762643 RepID=A0ABV7LU03_9GAMM